MTYTIQSAAYANPDHTAAVLQTVEAGAVLASEADTPQLWAQMLGDVEPSAYAPQVTVPRVVSRRQARQAMIAAGISFVDVQAAIDRIEDPTARAMMQSEWEDSNQFERDRPQLLALAVALGLDAAALDALFTDAGQR